MKTEKLEAALDAAAALVHKRLKGERALYVLLYVGEDGEFVIRSNSTPDQLEMIAEGLKQIAARARPTGGSPH